VATKNPASPLWMHFESSCSSAPGSRKDRFFAAGPACIAGVRVSEPSLRAPRGRQMLC
jgi:hypothetical protein